MLLVIYTQQLSRQFSATFRYSADELKPGLSVPQRREKIKQRHTGYYSISTYLRECIECFGSICPDKDFTVYHGVDRHVKFSSVYPYIKGPLSTTKTRAVAVNFSRNQGMILELTVNVNEWRQRIQKGNNRMNYIECDWISDFGAEQEVLFCVGISRLIINTIIDTKSGIDYIRYVRALRQMTYCTTNWNMALDMFHDNRPKKPDEKQLIWKLMSHELWKYHYEKFKNLTYKNNGSTKLAMEYKSCTKYVEDMVHSHCQHIKRIVFYDRLYFLDGKEYLLFDSYFRMDSYIGIG